MINDNQEIDCTDSGETTKLDPATLKQRWSIVSIFFLVCTLYELLARRMQWPQGYLYWLPFLTVFIACTITDLRWHKIRNYWTYTATIWLLLNCLLFQILQTVGKDFFWHSPPSFQDSLLGCVTCFMVLLFIYSASGGGAGDVKLAAVIGAGLGLYSGLMAIAYTYIAAACWVLARSVWDVGPLFMLMTVMRVIGNFLLPKQIDPPTPGEKKFMATQIPMAPFFATGVFFAILELLYL